MPPENNYIALTHKYNETGILGWCPFRGYTKEYRVKRTWPAMPWQCDNNQWRVMPWECNEVDPG